MYRQVPANPGESIYQKILFRENENEPMKIYSLNTVTHGKSCVSLFASHALQQSAVNEGVQHPIAATILQRDFYVDDLLTGTST